MKKRYFVAAAVSLLVTVFAVSISHLKFCRDPELISCIVSMDTAYMSVLAEGWELSEKEELQKEIQTLCRKTGASKRYISVYLTRDDLERGKTAFVIKEERPARSI